LEFNVPFQHKYGYIRDERSGVGSYPYPHCSAKDRRFSRTSITDWDLHQTSRPNSFLGSITAIARRGPVLQTG